MAHDALAMIQYRDDPAVLLFAAGAADEQAARRAVERAGCRLADSAPIAGAVARLDRQAWTDAVLVGASEEAEGLAALLERLNASAEAGVLRSVVSVPAELIDFAFARAPHPDVDLLSGADEEQTAAAVAQAAAPRPARLHDVGKSESAVLLHQMREQMGKMASLLAELTEEEGAAAATGAAGAGANLTAGYVRAVIRARRLRDQFFSEGLFADPAWDMLLDLMANRLEGRSVAVSSLCIAAAVPATTALRWIKLLTDQGLLVRKADPQDGRRVYIELAEDAARQLTAYLLAVQRISSLGM